MLRVTGLGYKASVGFVGVAFLVDALVTGCASEQVLLVKFDIAMAPLATDLIGGDNGLLLCLQLEFRRFSLIVPATAEHQ